MITIIAYFTYIKQVVTNSQSVVIQMTKNTIFIPNLTVTRHCRVSYFGRFGMSWIILNYQHLWEKRSARWLPCILSSVLRA